MIKYLKPHHFQQMKLKLFRIILLPLIVFGLPNNATAASCVAGAVTIASGSGGCDVDGSNAVTTVQFLTGATLTDPLTLQGGNTPSGAVTNQTDGQGFVIIDANTSSQNSFGVAGTGDLQIVRVVNGNTFNLGHNLATRFLQIYNASIINHSAGIITIASDVEVAGNSSYVQSGTGVINASDFIIGLGSSVTLKNQGTGQIRGLSGGGGGGTLIFSGDYNTDAQLGVFGFTLDTITVNDGVTLTLDQASRTDTLNVGQGISGILNHSAHSLITTNLNINDGAAYNLSGTGSIAATNIAIGIGSNLDINQIGNTSIASIMTGNGSLTKSNTGTVTLTGANTYSGGTTVSGGTLQGTTTSLQGNITNNANITFDQVSNGTFSDVISGSGSLIKSNTGTVILAGTNTYSGGTTVSGGILQGTTTSLQGDITNNANITFDQTSNGTFGNVISGTGSLTKNGTGFLTFTGNNTYTGTTTVADGILFIGDGSTTGSITGDVINNSQLTFTRSDASSYAGDISGTGSVAKQSAGTLTLTGDTTHTGGTTIVGGTLQIGNGGTTGSIASNITNNSSLIFNRSDALTYAGVIDGAGNFTQAGSGSTNLTGINTYTGATTINAGTLFVNGSNNASTTTVNTGGTLGGSGTVGSVIIASGGIFAPGNSIGTIDVVGNVDFSGGGIYQIEVDAAGNSDLINATGTATLGGGSVKILPGAGAYNFTTDYTILTAAGGLFSTFDSSSIDSNFAFLTPTLSYDSNNVFLNLTRNDTSFAGAAVTSNQIAVANTIAALSLSNPAAVTEIQNNLLPLTNSGAQQAFDSLSGVQYAVMPQINNKLMQRFLQLIRVRRGGGWNNQFSAYSPNSNPVMLANNDSIMTDLVMVDNIYAKNQSSHNRHWWMQGFAGDGNIDRDGSIARMDYRNNGLALGFDMPLTKQWTLGLAGSIANSDINGGGSNTDVDSIQLAIYANWQQNDWYADLATASAKHDTDSNRRVTVGLLTSIAKADYDSDTFGTSLEVGKRFHLQNKLNLSPFAGLEYSNTDRDGFTETGSFANLTVSSEEHESIRSKLGIRLSNVFKSNKGTMYIPTASIAYVHEYGDENNTMKAGLSTAPVTTFSVGGNKQSRERMQLGLGLTANMTGNSQISIDYNGEFAGSDDYHSLSATLRMLW